MSRGVSPVISSVLLTIIIVVVGVSVLFWGINFLGLTGQSIVELVSIEEERLREDFIIEHIIFNYNNNSLTLYVRNIGDIEIRIVSLYIMDYNASSNLETISLIDRNITVLIGKLIHFNVEVSTPLIKGHVYMIKIISERGVSYTIEVKAI